MSDIQPTTPPTVLPPNAIAFVIDGYVQEVIHCPDRLAAILTSNPTIVNVTNVSANVTIGYTYDATTGNFKDMTGNDVTVTPATPSSGN